MLESIAARADKPSTVAGWYFRVISSYIPLTGINIRKRINNSLIKSRFKVDKLINRSKVILLDNFEKIIQHLSDEANVVFQEYHTMSTTAEH